MGNCISNLASWLTVRTLFFHDSTIRLFQLAAAFSKREGQRMISLPCLCILSFLLKVERLCVVPL